MSDWLRDAEGQELLKSSEHLALRSAVAPNL